MTVLRKEAKIAPSILAADFTILGQQLQDCEDAGADYIHVDVMDGHFVPNISFGLPLVEASKRATEVPLDVHLMITEPERFLEAFAKAGANMITVQVEATVHLHRALQIIKELGKYVGVAINPLTPLQIVHDTLRDTELHRILLMSVNPGFGGQTFLESSLGRLETIKAWRDALRPDCEIGVDGGIHEGTIQRAYEAGADVLIAGSAVFNNKASIPENIKTLRSSLL
ncbi:MAG: ribulose-phosphate 3-epimerase [Trueperaceae bacterium]